VCIEGRLLLFGRDEADGSPLRFGRRHQFADRFEHHLELRIGLGLELIEPARELGVRGDGLLEPRKFNGVGVD
jgi:hypothetical protein